jgi:PAS domain S-box-containing protein
MSKKTIVGVLTIASKTPYHFSREEIHLMTNIGNQLGVAIENARLHEEIKKSETKYRVLVEDIKDGYFVCQGDVIVFVNDAFLGMFGYDREDVLGRDFRAFVGKASERTMDKVLKAQSPTTSLPEYLEFFRKHRNGRELPTEVKMTVSEIDGKPAVIGILRDISERKRMEQRIRENERLASIGALTSAIAHEIKNPLSAIKMNIQILSKSSNVHAADREHLAIAETEIKRLDGVLREMLHFVRPINMQAAYHSVSDIIEECIQLLHEKMNDSNIRVRWSKSDALPRIPVDSQKLKEAFLNIFLNAIAAMPRGGTISIFAERAGTTGQEFISVEIVDNGMGIARENIGKIFDPFFSTKSEGVGLGLSNVRKIVDAHGGTIEVQSTMNLGTSFKILLPLGGEAHLQ